MRACVCLPVAINLERLCCDKFNALIAKYVFCAVCSPYHLIHFLFHVSDCYIFAQGESHLAHEAAAALESQLSSEERKMKWEQGQADYMGMDSFDNIKKKLDTFLK